MPSVLSVLRSVRRLTVEELADRTSVGVSTVEKIESGRMDFSDVVAAQRLARFLDHDPRKSYELSKPYTEEKFGPVSRLPGATPGTNHSIEIFQPGGGKLADSRGTVHKSATPLFLVLDARPRDGFVRFKAEVDRVDEDVVWSVMAKADGPKRLRLGTAIGDLCEIGVHRGPAAQAPGGVLKTGDFFVAGKFIPSVVAATVAKVGRSVALELVA